MPRLRDGSSDRRTDEMWIEFCLDGVFLCVRCVRSSAVINLVSPLNEGF